MPFSEEFMRRIRFAIIGILCLSGSAWGQAPAVDQTELVRTLIERIDMLEKRVADLEGKAVCPSAPCEAGPPAAATAIGESRGGRDGAAPTAALLPGQEPRTPSAVEQQDGFPSMQIRGFADADFSASDQPGSFSGFNLGQFVLHVTSPLSRKITYFGETSFTARPSGYNLAVERSLIRFDYNDYFKLSFGKYHTPINYWNTAFHHGLWLQTTISRPEMIQFGGRFLPVHFVGLLGEGAISSGPAGLNYQVGIGNGRSTDIAQAGDSGDNNNHRAWVMNFFSKPEGIHGLQVGTSFYGDEITSGTLPPARELITSAHIVLAREGPEILAEFSNVHHRVSQTGATFNSQGYYVQLAYRLPWFESKWKPYLRFEHIHVPAGEPLLQVPNFAGSTLGIRYDISDFAAFKTEYRNAERGTNQPRFSGVFVQSSFTF
jgi:hypothetical protein